MKGIASRATRAFTVIELLIVVVIIAILSAVAFPMLLERLGQPEADPVTEQGTPDGTAQVSPPQLPPGSRLPNLDSAQATIDLRPEYLMRGFSVQTRYRAEVSARFELSATPGGQSIYLFVPFAEQATEADGVSLTLLDGSGEIEDPDGVIYDNWGIRWTGTVPESGKLAAVVRFHAKGYERFVYHLPRAARTGKVDVTINYPELSEQMITAASLQPTRIDEGSAQWQLDGLVTTRNIEIELPGRASPLGRMILLCQLAAIAVLLFGAGFWYLNELDRPGRLDDFRWGHFLLLASSYSLFFVVFVVLSLRLGQEQLWLNLALSLAVSMPLLVIHVWPLVGGRFALAAVLPLALISLGLVINGVYGGPMRDYVYIGALVLATVFITFTYERWSRGRTAYQEAEDLKRFRTTTCKQLDNFNDEGGGRRDKAGALLGEVEEALQGDAPRDELMVRDGLEQAAERLRKQRAQWQTIAESLATTKEMEVTDQFRAHAKEVIALAELWIAEADQQQEQVRQHLDRLRAHRDDMRRRALRQKVDEEKARQRAAKRAEEGERHCAACGTVCDPGTRHCPHCGERMVRTLQCKACGEATVVLMHLVSRKRGQVALFCQGCGERIVAGVDGN